MRALCVLSCISAMFFFPCLSNQSIPMKVKKAIYEFFETLENVDTSTILCEQRPDQCLSSDSLICDPDTNIPLVARPSLVDSRRVIYLDEEMITSIKQGFILSKEIRYRLLYLIGLLEEVKEQKKQEHYRQTASVAAAISGVCSIFGFQFAFFSWKDSKSSAAQSLAKMGFGFGILSAVCYAVHRKLQPTDPQQDLRDTIQKAHIFAQNFSHRL